MLGGPFEYLEHGHRVYRKFSRDIWKKSFEWKMGVLARSRNPILRLDFFKNRGFCTFPSIYCLWRVVWLWFFYWRKEQCQTNLLSTLNMVVECIENFLETFEKKISSQKWGFWQEVPTPFWDWIFQKSGFWHFSLNIFSLTCRMTLIFLLA